MNATATLLNPSLRVANIESLRRWGHRVGLKARDALHVGGITAAMATRRKAEQVDVLRFHHAKHPNHSFRVEPHSWLRLTEVQATKGIAHFLRLGGEARVLAFLRASDPDLRWPASLTSVQIEAELRLNKGRIDLIIAGTSDGLAWGAIIEAKFAHSSKDNPLPEYAKSGKGYGMAFAPSNGEARTGALLIVGQRICRQTNLRLRSNRLWRFLHWSTLLRRFEIELSGLPDDVEFRRFRRTLWERAT
ncbi:hypothetical protein SAMN05428984_4300 [Sphingomonas sp. OK281]|nr:hypothetical protein SAMN05428984_4300 [Sphingomonas sp. OK281]